ncbi:hypothetical protein, partial [Salmonella enterica]|uniref:hypothetical protein n=1 Tax=Salmonella enterica TaxID=28901 RepID=UPI00165455DA
MFRRQSLSSAALVEEPGTYYTDVIADADFPEDAQRADREVGMYAAVDLDELAGVAMRVSSYRGHIFETATWMGLPPAETETK